MSSKTLAELALDTIRACLDNPGWLQQLRADWGDGADQDFIGFAWRRARARAEDLVGVWEWHTVKVKDPHGYTIQWIDTATCSDGSILCSDIDSMEVWALPAPVAAQTELAV